MPSFDTVLEPNLVEVRNAVEQSAKEIGTRFDFKGSSARVELKDKEIMDIQALKFRLTPEHVAPMVLFLAADDSAGCTGQNFIVNAGNH